MIHYSKVVYGIQRYINEEIVAKLAGGVKGMALSIAGGVVAQRAGAIIRAYADNPMVKALGLIDGENVDADVLIAEMRRYMQQHGSVTMALPIVQLPITFTGADVDALDRYIKEA